jgi:DNA-binding MarR family transcriptional regulator
MSATSISSQAQQLARLTRDLSQCCQAKEEQLLAASGLSCSEGRVLLSIADHKLERASVVAEYLGISRGRLTPLVEKLVRKKLLTRTELPADRRSNRLMLTKAGEDLAKAVTGSQASFHENLLLRFRQEERPRLLGTLEQLRTAIEDLRGRLSSAGR